MKSLSSPMASARTGPAKNPAKGDAGFSLIEVLVALSVLAVGAASILALFAAGAATHRRAMERTRATLVAERVLESAQRAFVLGREPDEVVEVVRAELGASVSGYGYILRARLPDGPGWSPPELFVEVEVRPTPNGSGGERFHTILLPIAGAPPPGSSPRSKR